MIPLRSQLEEIELGLGLRYRYSDKLTLFGEVTGRVASDFVSLSSDDPGIGGKLGLRYAPHGDDSLYFILGAAVESNSSRIVTPAAGVHWEPNDRWTFNLIFPKPEIDYHLNPRITLFANAEGLGGTFRVGKNVHDRLFIGCRNQTLLVVDSLSGKNVATLPIGKWVDATVYDPVRHRVFASCAGGTLTVVRQDSADSYTIEEVVQTELGVRTMAFDSATNTIYAPSAKLSPISPEDPHPHPHPIPGTFHILVLTETTKK